MTHQDDFNEELLSAYLDGELTAGDEDRVERLLAQSDEHRQVLAELQELRAGMEGLPAYRLDDDFRYEVLAAIPPTEVEAARLDGRADADEDTPISVPEQRSPSGKRGTAARSSGRRTAAGWILGLSTLAGLLLLAWAAWSRYDGDRSTPWGSDWETVESGGSESSDGPATPEEQAPGELVHESPDRSPEENGLFPETIPGVGPVSPVDDEPRENIVEVQGERYVLVVEVEVTPEAIERQAFRDALSEFGIQIEDMLPVDEALEEVLLRNRFIEPVQEGEELPEVELVYVVSSGDLFNRFIPTIRGREALFPQVMMDLAVRPEQLQLFAELNRAAQEAAGPADAANQGTDTVQVAQAARWLELPERYRGRALQMVGLNGLSALTGLLTLDGPAYPVDAPVAEPTAAQPPAPDVADDLPPANVTITAEVLFVLRPAAADEDGADEDGAGDDD